MSANKNPKPHGIFEKPIKKTEALTLSLNRAASNREGVNSYAIRNVILQEEETERVCEANGKPAPARRTRPFFVRYDKQGVTRADKGYTKEQLEQDAERDSRHCVTLARNLGKAGHKRYDDADTQRLQEVDAHHIVASGHPAALGSRYMLFDWGIGINDADNGVFLPASVLAKPEKLANAVGHDDIHRSPLYYARVESRLMDADPADQASGRGALRKMRADMLSGAFPVK